MALFLVFCKFFHKVIAYFKISYYFCTAIERKNVISLHLHPKFFVSSVG